MSPEIGSDQLLELQRQATLGRLLAGVAHEISAPLGSILSNLDLRSRLLDRIEAAAGDAGSARVQELVAACRELARVDRVAGERIGKLVRSLKVAARVTDSQPQIASVNEIVDCALQLARANFGSRIAIQADFGDLPEIWCRADRLGQAILNLVTNAGQAIEGSGAVTVGTRREGDAIHIWVADTGQGIRDADKPKILWQGFTTKALGLGTGLGLLIVRQIVEEHGGAIDFESKVGRGTTFHVRLPIRRQEEGE
jgi:signal transduction histidine kinase